MPVDLPDLANRDYTELREDMLLAIPKYSSGWTDYNVSDPGVAIAELLAWVGESLLYRINDIPYETYLNFLRLFAGVYDEEIETLIDEKKSYDKEHVRLLEFLEDVEKKSESGEKVHVAEIMAAARKFFYSPYRAISEEDFKILAVEAAIDETNGESDVKRVLVSTNPEDGKVEIVVVPSLGDRFVESEHTDAELIVGTEPFVEESYKELRVKVKSYLNDRKLVGTPIEVLFPEFTPVSLHISLVCDKFFDSYGMLTRVKERIITFLDPLAGGDSGKGRAVGRTLSVYEVAHLADQVEGVTRVEWLKSDDASFLQKEIKGLLWLEKLQISAKKEEDK